MKSKDDKLGFPPGVAAKILLSVSSFFFLNQFALSLIERFLVYVIVKRLSPVH